MSRLAQRALPRIHLLTRPGFHLQMAYANAAILILSFMGCKLAAIHNSGPYSIPIALAVEFGAVLPIALYWSEKGRIDLRDAALTIPWALLLSATIRFPVAIAARMGKETGLQDANFARWDQAFGVRIPDIVAWSSHHWLGVLANKSYWLLTPLLVISFLLPALTGRAKHAQQFLIANLVAFAIAIPLSALAPAIGPWYHFHSAATSSQVDCQATVLLIRSSAPYSFPPDVLICFPSFHVIWAILAARALWGFRLLRGPIVILSGLIVFSTIATGWHYLVDVMAGIIVAVVSIAGARLFCPGRSPESLLKDSRPST
jgi:hypothetical protein